jgi:Mg2+ and Co2+ transporter CorA
MNQKDDDKATASLLLSTDEAVAEKIRRVLANNPDIIADAMKKVEESLMIRHREAEYARALGQSMMQTKNQAAQNMFNNTFATSNTSGQIANNQNAIHPLPWEKFL